MGWSKILISIGIICAVIAIVMETSVATGSGRVQNLGLMSLQTNLLIFSGITFISGILLLRHKSKSKSSDIPSDGIRICPFCAEQIKANAKICRFCQRDLPEVDVEQLLSPENNSEQNKIVDREDRIIKHLKKILNREPTEKEIEKAK